MDSSQVAAALRGEAAAEVRVWEALRVRNGRISEARSEETVKLYFQVT